MHALVQEGKPGRRLLTVVQQALTDIYTVMCLCQRIANAGQKRCRLIVMLLEGSVIRFCVVRTFVSVLQVAWRCFTCTTVAVLVVTQLNPE